MLPIKYKILCHHSVLVRAWIDNEFGRITVFRIDFRKM
jgi:hypothetical protein